MISTVFLLLSCFFVAATSQPQDDGDLQLTSTNDSFMSRIAGFTARLQCSVMKCGRQRDSAATIVWLKDDVLIFNGTEFSAASGFEPSRIVLQRQQEPSGDNCATDEFSLLLRNLTRQDAGLFRCQLLNSPQQLDFHLDVLESGLKAGFHQNFTYDYVECCLERGILPLCRAMCRPRDMDVEFFDPTSCRTDDYRNFLRCATDSGRRDYVPCCRQRAVPAFCYDFCSNDFQMLKRSHRLCLYYLPEIFSCFSKQYELYPPSMPIGLRIGAQQRLCWRRSTAAPIAVDPSAPPPPISYSVHVRAVPDVMLRSSAAIINNGRALAIKSDPNASADGSVSATRGRREAVVLVAQESSADKGTHFIKIDPNDIEQCDATDEICVSWRGWLLPHDGGRYIVYVQASNEYGASEPSQPLFVTTPKTDEDNDQAM